MAKIIIFNSPPEGGKDIAATRSVKHLKSMGVDSVAHHEFKGQLFKLTKSIYGIRDDVWDGWYTRDGKELPRPELDGLSCRGALIHVSENIIKPNYGVEYFGKFAAKYDEAVICFSDGGFPSEVMPLIEKHGRDNIAVVRIHREGCNFDNDSRSYLPDGIVDTMYDVENFMPATNNDKEFDEFLNMIQLIVDNFMLGRAWGAKLLDDAGVKLNGENPTSTL